MIGQGETGWTLADIAAQLGGDVLGDGQTPIQRVATLASAGAGDIAFLANRKYKSQLQTTQAAAVILAPPFADEFAGPRIVTARSPGFAGTVPAKSEKYRTVGDVNHDVSKRMAASVPEKDRAQAWAEVAAGP